MRYMLLNHIIKRSFSYKLSDKQKVVFFGSYPVGYPTLLKLHRKFGSENLEVITHQSSTENSKSLNLVQQFCHKQSITLHMPINRSHKKQQKIKRWTDLYQKMSLNDTEYKLGIVCSYGYMIPSKIIKLFKDQIILIHPSLIPKYRGAAPIFHAIANGDKISGVSYLELIADGFDIGNVLYQKQYQLSSHKKYRQLQKQLAQQSSKHIQYVIDNLSSLKPGIPQSELLAKNTIQPRHISAKLVHNKQISPNKLAQQIYNLSRAIETPRFKFKDKILIINFEAVYLEDAKNQYKPGQLVLNGKKLYMKCQDKLIKIKGWQQPTKKQLPAYMFINQYIGDRKNYENNLYLQ